MKESIADPRRKCIARVKAKVFNPYKEPAGVGRSYFSLYNRDSHRQKAHADTLDATSDDEGSKVRGKYCDECRDEVYSGTNANRSAASEYIAYVRSDKGG